MRGKRGSSRAEKLGQATRSHERDRRDVGGRRWSGFRKDGTRLYRRICEEIKRNLGVEGGPRLSAAVRGSAKILLNWAVSTSVGRIITRKLRFTYLTGDYGTMTLRLQDGQPFAACDFQI